MAALGVLVSGCGSKTGLDAPPPCARSYACPMPDDFCRASALCLEGYCAIGPAPDCSDAAACTDDVCDPGLASCLHPLRDRDDDGYDDGSCGGDDCDDHEPSAHPGADERCTGGLDDDCDGTFDCSDADCEADLACAACDPERCDGGLDEDCDGAVDCADTDCTCCTAREVDCDDARDEDCDAQVDCLDPDCTFAPTCCVPSPETCNELDDDCDGVADDGITCFFLDGMPIDAIPTTACGRDWYAYDSPDRASADPEPDLRGSSRVAVAIVGSPLSCGGAAVAVIADQVRDGSGGSLRASFSVDRPGVGGVLVSDDPPECSWDGSSRSGACTWRWEPCCTDGVLVGPLGADFCLTLVLSEPSGVSSVVVLEGTHVLPRSFGAPIELCGRTVPVAP